MRPTILQTLRGFRGSCPVPIVQPSRGLSDCWTHVRLRPVYCRSSIDFHSVREMTKRPHHMIFYSRDADSQLFMNLAIAQSIDAAHQKNAAGLLGHGARKSVV